jgi:hypothetical protein
MTLRDLFWLDVGSLLSFAGMVLGHRLTKRAFRLHEARISGQR